MTRARMIALQDALERAGWSISGYPDETDLYLVEDEKITWKLLSANHAQSIDLVFFLFDHLGRRTDNLADISRADAMEKSISLYFSKINSSDWKSDLKEFVQNLY